MSSWGSRFAFPNLDPHSLVLEVYTRPQTHSPEIVEIQFEIDNLKNEVGLNIKMTLNMKTTSKMKTT